MDCRFTFWTQIGTELTSVLIWIHLVWHSHNCFLIYQLGNQLACKVTEQGLSPLWCSSLWLLVVGTEKNRLNETVLLSTPLPPLFLTNIMITYFFIHVAVVHMLLNTFAMLDWWPYIFFWWEMTSRHLTLRQSERNLAGSDATSSLTMDSQHIP